MLTFGFYDYNEFKNIFGMDTHGNGNKSRRNKILLAMLTSREFWKNIRTAPLSTSRYGQPISDASRDFIHLLLRGIMNMTDLRLECIRFLDVFKGYEGYHCHIRVSDNDEQREYRLMHDVYEVDNNGVCYDGDTKSIRYINHDCDGRVFKMRAGKFLRRLIDANQFGKLLPEQVKVWLCEDFAERWQAYAQSKVESNTLHISDEREAFKRIYDSDNYDGDFGSCMSHDGGSQSSFYVDAVKAKAAWLENREGRITARCVIFTDATDEDGNKWRLAERQYATDGDNVLKRMLVDKLIAANEIDAYKQIGVDCHNATAWVKNDGTSISDKRFSIECNLEDDDIMSYQDSFKWYDMDNYTAYNYPESGAIYELDDTSKYFRPHDGKVWSEYEGEWIDEDNARYIDTRDDWYYDDDCRYCENTRSYEFVNDCVQLGNGDWAYNGEDGEGYEGVEYCEHCGEYYLSEDMRYSELLDEWYCDDCANELEQEYMKGHAKENGYRYDAYDGEWYDPKEWSDVRVLNWDIYACKRKNAYTRRRNLRCYNITRYKGNWYCGYLWRKVDGVIVPREVVA